MASWRRDRRRRDPAGTGAAAFTDAEALNHTSTVSRGEYAERIVRGGFPEAVARANPARRERFFDSYVADLVARDVSQLSEIERPAQLRALLRLLAARSGAAPGRQRAEQRAPGLRADRAPLPEPARGSLLDQADPRMVAQRVQPQHRTHHQVIELTTAEARGQARLVEMNQQVLGNLDRIITTLAEDPTPTREVSDAG